MNKTIEESVTSTNTQVTTICAKELRGEAGCKELCDECKRKMQEAAVSTETEGWTRVVLLKELSKEKGIPLVRLMMGFMNNYLYVWDYDSGRHPGDQFRVIKIIPDSNSNQ